MYTPKQADSIIKCKTVLIELPRKRRIQTRTKGKRKMKKLAANSFTAIAKFIEIEIMKAFGIEVK